MKEFCRRISESHIFNKFIMITILIAGFNVGLQTSPGMNADFENLLWIVDQVILWIFVLEIIVHIGQYGTKFWRFFLEPWYIFDFAIVAVCFIPLFVNGTDTSYFAILRLARVARLFKIFETITNLKIIINSLIRSIPSFAYVLLLLLLQFYIYSVIGADMFGKIEPGHFGNIVVTMKTLFHVVYEGWNFIYDLPGFTAALERGYDDTWLTVYFVTFMIGSVMIVLNLFIGIITSEMSSSRALEEGGRKKIYKKNHTVILGWSENIFNLLEELIIANESENSETVVILADKPRKDMEEELETKIRNFKTTHVHCRSGSQLDVSHLEIVNPGEARSVIILSDNLNDNSDITVLKTLMALSNHRFPKSNPDMYVVVELKNHENLKIAQNISKNRAVFLTVDLFVSRIIAQTCLQRGLFRAISELIGYDGSEIYIWHDEILVGKSFGEISFMFNRCIPIGIMHGKGNPELNPNPETIYSSGEKLILIALDDSKIKLDAKKGTQINGEIIKHDEIENEAKKRDILILGWNRKAPMIINEIGEHSAKGSSIKIVSQFESSPEINLPENLKENIEVTHEQGRIEDPDTLSKYLHKCYSNILILSYSGSGFSAQESDAITLITLLQIHEIGSQKSFKYNVLAEISDVRNTGLIDNDEQNDFVISSRINSAMAAQMSQQREIIGIFDSLLGNSKPNIRILKAGNYIQTGIESNFNTIVKSAMNKNQIAIGYRTFDKINGKESLTINPPKNRTIKFESRDDIILIF